MPGQICGDGIPCGTIWDCVFLHCFNLFSTLFSPQYFMNKHWKKNTTTKTDKKTTGSYWCTFNHCIIINASNCFLQIIIGPKSDHCLALSVTESLLVLNFAQIVGFVKVVQLISLDCYTDLLQLLHRFLKMR